MARHSARRFVNLPARPAPARATLLLAMTGIFLSGAFAPAMAQHRGGFVPTRPDEGRCYLPYNEWEKLYRNARALASRRPTHPGGPSLPPYVIGGADMAARADYYTARGAYGFSWGDSAAIWDGPTEGRSRGGQTLPDHRTARAEVQQLQLNWQVCYRPRPITVRVEAQVRGTWLDTSHEATITLNPTGRHSPDLWIRRGELKVMYEASPATVVSPSDVAPSPMVPPELEVVTRPVNYLLGAHLVYDPRLDDYIEFNLSVEREPEGIMHLINRETGERYPPTGWAHGDLASAGWVGLFNMPGQRIGSESWERTPRARHGFWRWRRAVYEGRRDHPGGGYVDLKVELIK